MKIRRNMKYEVFCVLFTVHQFALRVRECSFLLQLLSAGFASILRQFCKAHLKNIFYIELITFFWRVFLTNFGCNSIVKDKSGITKLGQLETVNACLGYEFQKWRFFLYNLIGLNRDAHRRNSASNFRGRSILSAWTFLKNWLLSGLTQKGTTKIKLQESFLLREVVDWNDDCRNL